MFPIKYIDNNLVWNKDNEVFAYYELIPYVNGKIKITKKVGLTITSYGNDRLPTGYLF